MKKEYSGAQVISIMTKDVGMFLLYITVIAALVGGLFGVLWLVAQIPIFGTNWSEDSKMFVSFWLLLGLGLGIYGCVRWVNYARERAHLRAVARN